MNHRSSSHRSSSLSRRRFLSQAGLATAGCVSSFARETIPVTAQSGAGVKLALGIDNFAVRAMKWKAEELLDYSAQLKVDSLFITDLDALRNSDDASLAEVRKLAKDKGIRLYLGTWSICPSSKSFKDKWGTADEHLALGVRMAKALGSPVLRVVLGARGDRLTPGGIDARIDDTVKVLKRNKARCIDAGVKIAMENHAGDMHSIELVRLIEDAGKDFVGANMDSGNAVWTMEDPVENLRNLGPYALTTSLRDTALWESKNGVSAQWTAMGEGTTDLKGYFELYKKLCPKCPVHIETISGFNHELKVKDDSFWKAWPNGKPKGYDKFLALAKKGKERKPWRAPEGVDRNKAQQDYQKGEIERSIKYCRETLGLGLR